jgi:hypothetical protein
LKKCNAHFEFENCEKIGNWSENEVDIFTKIIRRARHCGLQRPEISLSLKTQLPHKSAEQISLYESWFNASRQIQRKRKESVDKYTSKRAEMVAEIVESTSKYKAELLQRRLHDEEIQMHEQYRSELHEKYIIFYISINKIIFELL